MRQRRVKNEGERIASHAEFIVDNPCELRGKWADRFYLKGDIYMEFGCGRGKFITTLAEQHPDRNYIGIEARSSVVLRSLEKAKAKELNNTLFIIDYVKDICQLFDENELAGMYLNFSDPWPKERHAKRRLTHRNYLESCRKILKPGSLLEIKTDNDKLFQFTLEELKACSMEILEQTTDLHNSTYRTGNITTEYEERFRRLRETINYCKVRV